MIRRISAIILIVFFFLLPFHAFLVTWLNVGLGLDSIWVTLWRELFIAILTILAIGNVILRQRPEAYPEHYRMVSEGLSNVTPSPVLSLSKGLSKGDLEPLYTQLKKITLLDWLIAAYFLLGAVFFFYKRESISQWLLGARYDFEFLYFYWLVRVFGFGAKEIWAFFKSALTAAVLVVIFGWVLYFLPQDFLTKFGYAAYADEWNPGSAVFACHYVEFDQSFCRMQSTFGGPGRYGLYLLFVTIASGVMASIVIANTVIPDGKGGRLRRPTAPDQESLSIPSVLGRHSNLKNTPSPCHCEEADPRPVSAKAGKQSPREYFNIRQKFFWLIFFLLSLAALYLTLSRSAWIGLFGAISVCAIFLIKKLPQWKRVLAKSAVVAAIGALIFTFLAPTSFKTIIIRSASTSQHIEAFVKGGQTAVAHPFGIGLGKAGPASVPFEKFFTENAYLQVIVEMGFLGGALFLAILTIIMREVASSLSFLTARTERSEVRLETTIRAMPAGRQEANTLPQAAAPDQESHTILAVPGRCPNLKNTPNVINITNFINSPLRHIFLLTLISLMLSGLFVHSFEEMSLSLTLFGLIGLITER